MTKEELMKKIEKEEKWLFHALNKTDKTSAYSVDIAFDAVKHHVKDYIDSQPCDDCISRAEVLETIDTWDKFGYTETGCFVRLTKELDENYVGYVHLEDVINAILGLPSVSPRQKMGRWVFSEVRCPDCLEYFDADNYSFEKLNICPSCGAEMEVKE